LQLKDIVIKDNFEPHVSFGQGKLLAQGTLHSFPSLPWLGIETFGSKISYYCNIFLSFYHNIVCQNVSCEKGLPKAKRETYLKVLVAFKSADKAQNTDLNHCYDKATHCVTDLDQQTDIIIIEPFFDHF